MVKTKKVSNPSGHSGLFWTSLDNEYINQYLCSENNSASFIIFDRKFVCFPTINHSAYILIAFKERNHLVAKRLTCGYTTSDRGVNHLRKKNDCDTPAGSEDEQELSRILPSHSARTARGVSSCVGRA